MFCPFCGAENEENSRFCAKCGGALTQQPATEAVPQSAAEQGEVVAESVQTHTEAAQSTVATVVAPPQQPKKKKGRLNYFYTASTSKLKIFMAIVAVLGIVGAVMTYIGYQTLISTDIMDMLVMQIAADNIDELGDSVDALKDNIKDTYKETQEQYRMYEYQFSKSDQKKIEAGLDAMKDCSKNLSINNLSAFLEAAAEITEMDEFDEAIETVNLDSLSSVATSIEDILEIKNIVLTVLFWFYMIIALLSLLGGLLQSNGWIVPALIMSTLFLLPFCDLVYPIIGLVAHIAAIVLICLMNAEYRAYRRGTLKH